MLLETTLASGGGQIVKLITGPDGRFDFAGIRHGKHTVRTWW